MSIVPIEGLPPTVQDKECQELNVLRPAQREEGQVEFLVKIEEQWHSLSFKPDKIVWQTVHGIVDSWVLIDEKRGLKQKQRFLPGSRAKAELEDIGSRHFLRGRVMKRMESHAVGAGFEVILFFADIPPKPGPKATPFEQAMYSMRYSNAPPNPATKVVIRYNGEVSWEAS